MTVFDSPTGTCSLCKRDVPRHMITLHHLKPREKGGRAEHRTPLCRPCHKQLHALSSNAKLAKSFGRIDLLKTAPELQPFLSWIRNTSPSGTSARSSRMVTRGENGGRVKASIR